MSKDEKEICLYCKFWVLEGFRHTDEGFLMQQEGDCRRKSPDRKGGELSPNAPAWPVMRGGGFCGEFKGHPDDHDSDNWQSIGDAANAVVSQFKPEGENSA